MDVQNILKLTQLLEDALPQTQCTKCGFPDCHGYAQALANDEVQHNRCPPGGQAGIDRLSKILQRPTLSLEIECGIEKPRTTAVIDPKQCIGCTLCIKACPVDAIVGAAKQLHVVLVDRCTGCDLCIPPCPVDCIEMVEVSGSNTGWSAWTQEQANQARNQYQSRKLRLVREKEDNDKRLAQKAADKLKALNAEVPTNEAEATETARKKAIIAAAIARAQAKLNPTT